MRQDSGGMKRWHPLAFGGRGMLVKRCFTREIGTRLTRFSLSAVTATPPGYSLPRFKSEAMMRPFEIGNMDAECAICSEFDYPVLSHSLNDTYILNKGAKGSATTR